jgi:hypothetical protein
MKKQFKWLMALAAAALLVAAIAVPVLAAGPNGPESAAPPATQPAYGNGHCQGLGSGINEAVTTLLGMTREQIQAERQAGKSLVQIAGAKDITEGELIEAIMAGKQEAVEKMVESGTITREQADQRLEQMRERVEIAVNRTTVGPPEWAGANGQGQNGSQSRGQAGPKGNRENCTGTPGTCTGAGKMDRAGKSGN